MSAPTPVSKSALPKQDVSIEKAIVHDADRIRSLVVCAYSKYVERMGKEPAPMMSDYRAIIQTQSYDVFVLRTNRDGRVLGSILLSDHEEDDAIEVNNVVIDPTAQGSGYGRQLLNFAEEIARAKGRKALILYTNEKMHENIALYPKLGFVETERKTEDGYHRVYFRRSLSSAAA